MKKKVKKLSVSKETLCSLKDSKLDAAQGAAFSDKTNCIVCTYTCN